MGREEITARRPRGRRGKQPGRALGRADNGHMPWPGAWPSPAALGDHAGGAGTPRPRPLSPLFSPFPPAASPHERWGSHRRRPQTGFGHWCGAGAGALSTRSGAEGKFNQRNEVGHLISFSLFFFFVFVGVFCCCFLFLFSEEGKKNPTNFVCESLLAEGAGLRRAWQGLAQPRVLGTMLRGGRLWLSPPSGTGPLPLLPTSSPSGQHQSPRATSCGGKHRPFEVAFSGCQGPLWGHILPSAPPGGSHAG